MKPSEFIKKNAIVFSAALLSLVIITNVVLIIYNNKIIEKAYQIQLENEKIKTHFTLLWNDGVRNLDLAIRGYVITKQDKMLFPYENALKFYNEHMGALKEAIKGHGEENKIALAEIEAKYDSHIKYTNYLLDLVKKDSIETFKEELEKDRGYDLWIIYEKNSNQVMKSFNDLNLTAKADYEHANKRIIILQVILALLGLPTIFFMVYKIRKDQENRQKLFIELEKNNREYLFDPGTPLVATDEKVLINDSIVNLKNAADFISQISKGNFEVDWQKLNKENRELNQNNLIGELIQMREKMKDLKSDDQKRIWAADGLASLSEIIRNHQHDLKDLCYQVLVFAVKYMNAQQGGLFLVQEDEEGTPFLELGACYAFDRKKYLNKRIEVGEGLVGQIYLEQKYFMSTTLPEGYSTIASGLGEKSPKCLLIVPMIYNEKVEAVVEIASFAKFEPYQIEFIEKIGDITASTIGTVKNNEKTKELLEQFKIKTEQLRDQEEELKQNMEEMLATQEALRRAEQERAGE